MAFPNPAERDAGSQYGRPSIYVPGHRERALLTAIEEGLRRAVSAAVTGEIERRDEARQRAIEGK
jgi:hypothetical protein